MKIQESTMQVPIGKGSAFSELRAGNLKAVDTLLSMILNAQSNWDSGQTAWLSHRQIAKQIGISVSYVRASLARLQDGCVSILKRGQRGTRYQLTHHRVDDAAEVPQDRDGLPLKCAVPRGEGGPIERMILGEIRWKACLLWIILKTCFSDYRTGITIPCAMQRLAQLTGFGKATVCACIAELQAAGMLERLSQHNHISVFQLYPKPPEKRAARCRQKPQPRPMRQKGEWRYSWNEQYRISAVTTGIEVKKGGRWRAIHDSERHKIPGAIARAFAQVVAQLEQMSHIRELRKRLGVAH